MAAPIITAASFGGPVGFPTVAHAAGRVSNPLAEWYMLVAPHDGVSSSVSLYYAAALTGPWTRHGSGPVMPIPAGGYRHISSPFAVWNPAESIWFVYAHMLYPDPSTEQRTFLWTTTDFLSYVIQNEGNPVLPTPLAGDVDKMSSTYFRCAWDGRQWIGVSQGNPGVGSAHIVEYTSPDGRVWTNTRNLPNGQAWQDEAGESSQDPTPFVLDDGRVIVHYASRLDTTRTVCLWRERRADGSYSRRRMWGLQAGLAAAWDSAQAQMDDIVIVGGTAYAAYTGTTNIADNLGDQIGMATVATTRTLRYGALTGKA